MKLSYLSPLQANCKNQYLLSFNFTFGITNWKSLVHFLPLPCTHLMTIRQSHIFSKPLLPPICSMGIIYTDLHSLLGLIHINVMLTTVIDYSHPNMHFCCYCSYPKPQIAVNLYLLFLCASPPASSSSCLVSGTCPPICFLFVLVCLHPRKQAPTLSDLS